MLPETIDRDLGNQKIVPAICLSHDPLVQLPAMENCFCLLILHTGSLQFQSQNQQITATAPCVICLDEYTRPLIQKTNRLGCHSVYFHPTFLNVNMTFQQIRSPSYQETADRHNMFLLKPFTDPKELVYPCSTQQLQTFLHLFIQLKDELLTQRDWYWSCRSRSYFLEMIILLERIHGTTEQISPHPLPHVKNPVLINALTYISHHFSQKFTLHQLALKVASNHSTLTTLFKRELHTTPMEYVWQYRIGVAKKHLAFTGLTVKEIADRCGFQTTQHFSSKFQSYTGQSPTAFREQAVANRKAAF